MRWDGAWVRVRAGTLWWVFHFWVGSVWTDLSPVGLDRFCLLGSTQPVRRAAAIYVCQDPAYYLFMG